MNANTRTGIVVKIAGIPTASPFSVFNGRTGHVVETRSHGVVRIRLAVPVSIEDARLAEVHSIADLTSDPQRYEIDVLDKYLTSDVPEVLPGREVPTDLVEAAYAEIGSAYRRAYRRSDADGLALTQAEFWGAVRQFVTRRTLDALIPESVVTPEDARAWMYDHAKREQFGL